MPQPASITLWIRQLKEGDSEAAQRLWETYFQRMVQLARQKLEGIPRAVADEEDVAVSAFRSFCMGARAGRFSQLADRDNLWPLLMALTANKSVDLIRARNRQKRGGTGKAGTAGRQTTTDPARSHPSPGKGPGLPAVPLSEILSREPTPEFAAELSDQLARLLQLLDETGDPDLRRIALLKMEGSSSAEVAAAIPCATRSVERKMQVIMRLWAREMESDPEH
jgi:DNA-directed RNA polymerase specialized sigma24 family protein